MYRAAGAPVVLIDERAEGASLTTLEQPLEAIAREAHRLAVAEHDAILAKPRRVLLPPTLVRRLSA